MSRLKSSIAFMMLVASFINAAAAPTKPPNRKAPVPTTPSTRNVSDVNTTDWIQNNFTKSIFVDAISKADVSAVAEGNAKDGGSAGHGAKNDTSVPKWVYIVFGVKGLLIVMLSVALTWSIFEAGNRRKAADRYRRMIDALPERYRLQLKAMAAMEADERALLKLKKGGRIPKRHYERVKKVRAWAKRQQVKLEEGVETTPIGRGPMSYDDIKHRRL